MSILSPQLFCFVLCWPAFKTVYCVTNFLFRFALAFITKYGGFANIYINEPSLESRHIACGV